MSFLEANKLYSTAWSLFWQGNTMIFSLPSVLFLTMYGSDVMQELFVRYFKELLRGYWTFIFEAVVLILMFASMFLFSPVPDFDRITMLDIGYDCVFSLSLALMSSGVQIFFKDSL